MIKIFDETKIKKCFYLKLRIFYLVKPFCILK